MYSIFGTKQYDEQSSVHNYIIPSSEVLVKQTGEGAINYSLKNLELEYETIINDVLASQITSMFSTGKSLIYEHVIMFKQISWPKAADTVQYINVTVPRKSM